MAVPAYVTFDTQAPERIVPFWCDLLEVEVQITRDEGRYVVLAPSRLLPGSMMLVFQRVPEPKTGKNRMHVDVIVDDIEEATRKVEALGGRWIEPGHTQDVDGYYWRVMADPEGNEFCICLNPQKRSEK
jgi:predicted enzyme related to lactoylglutathione lyase